jgi:transposase
VNDRKRHILTDTIGLLVGAIVRPADMQDRDGTPRLLQRLCNAFPWLYHLFADGAYALPRRWVVERTFARLSRNRRLAKDFEATIASAST